MPIPGTKHNNDKAGGIPVFLNITQPGITKTRSMVTTNIKKNGMVKKSIGIMSSTPIYNKNMSIYQCPNRYYS